MEVIDVTEEWVRARRLARGAAGELRGPTAYPVEAGKNGREEIGQLRQRPDTRKQG